jgi:hypothetical protein
MILGDFQHRYIDTGSNAPVMLLLHAKQLVFREKGHSSIFEYPEQFRPAITEFTHQEQSLA